MLFETARANRVNCCNRFLSELACMDRYLTLPRRFSTELAPLSARVPAAGADGRKGSPISLRFYQVSGRVCSAWRPGKGLRWGTTCGGLEGVLPRPVGSDLSS